MGSTSWPAPNADPNLDRVVSDVQYEQMARMYAGNGLYGDPSMPSLVYGDGTGRNVKFLPNRMGMVGGHPWRSDSSGVVLPVSTSTGARNDLVVLRLDRATWLVTPQIREGIVGGSLPSPQVDLDTAGAGAGVWELPVAKLATPSGSAGITAAMVTDIAWYLAPQAYVGRSTSRPPVAPGLEFTEVDTARRLAALGSSFAVIGENGTLTKLSAPSTAWDATRYEVYFQRRNGWTWMQGLAYRATGQPTLATGVDILVARVPTTFCPTSDSPGFYLDGGMSGNAGVRLFLSQDGALTLLDHDPLAAGQFVQFGPFPFPSR